MNVQTNATIPVQLRCNFWENPLGVDVTNPVLGWTIKTASITRAMHQKAYRILVSTSAEALKNDKGNLWDSGKIISDRMGQVVYSGLQLKSSQACWWKVKIWDEKGKPSLWSEPSQWTMGVLNDTDW